MMRTENLAKNGFRLTLLLLAALGLGWLFAPFLPALFFAMLVAIASFSQFEKLKRVLSPKKAALSMTVLVTLVIIFPLFYVLLASSLEITQALKFVADVNLREITQSFLGMVEGLPFGDKISAAILTMQADDAQNLLLAAKDFSVMLLNSIVSLSSNFLVFWIITIFSLYYFYLDGATITRKIKQLSPLEARMNDALFTQFSQLSVTLLGSVFFIAILYGGVFSIGVAIIGLPAFYFGVMMAVASFIPVLGGLIIWAPLTLYLLATDQILSALIIIFFGAFLCGILIDNFIRPLVIKRLSKNAGESALNHTLITVLSTLAGIIQFGVLGLFLGPIIAAMAISIFNLYDNREEKSDA